MKQQPSLAMVDELARLAGQAEPPVLDEVRAHRMLDTAVRAAVTMTPVARPRGSRWPLALAGAAVCAVLALLWLRPPQVPQPELLRATLPTGDRIVGSAGARFAIEELAPTSRRLRLDGGAMVFDVARVAAGQRFEVKAGAVMVVATGTVFAVSLDGGDTSVSVFEGAVEITDGGRLHTLGAGGHWSSGGHGGRAAAAITAAGEAFARERMNIAVAQPLLDPTAPSPSPDPSPSPSPSPDPDPSPSPSPSPSPGPGPGPSPGLGSQPQPQLQPGTTGQTGPGANAANGRGAASSANVGKRRDANLEPVPTDAVDSTAQPAPRPAVVTAAPASIDAARADIAAGRYDAALNKVNATSRTGTSGNWELVRGDALRAQKKHAAAAAAFESAAQMLEGPASHEAAYTAAYIRYHDLREGERALSDLTGVDAEGSQLEERALVLRAQILTHLKRTHEAAVIAARYLDRFPNGSSARIMRALTAPESRPAKKNPN